jgi:hypothetical protein
MLPRHDVVSLLRAVVVRVGGRDLAYWSSFPWHLFGTEGTTTLAGLAASIITITLETKASFFVFHAHCRFYV